MYERLIQKLINRNVGAIAGEGKAFIVRVVFPSKFTPGVMFGIATIIRNDGDIDDMFIRITNIDTGEILDEGYIYDLPSGASDDWVASVTLTQTTDFHGRVDAGHVE